MMKTITQRNPSDKRYKLDYSRKVKVYRNLHKNCYSVMQDGLVKAHSDEVDLWDCAFQVNQKNRQKVLDTGVKNVHAFVIGYVSSIWFGDFASMGESTKVRYNPREYSTFIVANTGKPCFTANSARLDSKGIRASFVPSYFEDELGNVTTKQYS